MKRLLPFLLVAGLHCAHAVQPAAAPAAAAKPVQVEELVDHWGDSPQTAVTVPADAPDGGVEFENGWILERFGRFTREGGGTGTLEGRRYNVVKIELESGEKKSVYFDITDLWARAQ
jgi:hypothetical protein